MAALKKAAKKMARKSAKKGAKRAHGVRYEARDLRRAYEHLGRLDAMRAAGLPGQATQDLATLTELARQSLPMGDAQSAADLLRGGEHLSFAALATPEQQGGLSDELESALVAEYEHLRLKAEDHWNEHEAERNALAGIYERAWAVAEAALKKGAYRMALESARAAEALAHVKLQLKAVDEGVRERGRLKA